MDLMPQTAGTASFSQKIAPFFSSNNKVLLAEVALLTTSLWKLISPKWSTVGLLLSSFLLAPSDVPPTEVENTLNAFLIGSATTQPTTLWDEMNRNTCKWWQETTSRFKNDADVRIIKENPSVWWSYWNSQEPFVTTSDLYDSLLSFMEKWRFACFKCNQLNYY